MSIAPFLGVIISRKMCSFRDLKECLTIEDALDLYYIVLVDYYNEKIED